MEVQVHLELTGAAYTKGVSLKQNEVALTVYA